ncbi:motility accessory factor [Campylobacter sp. MIT 99-7217]|uniref:motility associated factor glycosyltransferase family protein n=1 Tax=Campylobacter sp. MIT 99-7217 TaxID=535091 RepID=UPI00115AF84C|nr:6-hydroxymethylpterin diphosphokinase MptE-like protein [Campylobacter sp. MIT 99-7217]TQR33043.1 motility accessory factor [Campylobacter sp. MIT 99-7217]
MNTILQNNINALASGTNKPLAQKLLVLLDRGFTRFFLDEHNNIFDKKKQSFFYENLADELTFFEQKILHASFRYPILFLYGIGNGLLLQNLAHGGGHYSRIFVFEEELELIALALSVVDLSKELSQGSIHILDMQEDKRQIQALMLFDHKNNIEYLSLYELFITNFYYENFYKEKYLLADEFCKECIFLVSSPFLKHKSLYFTSYEHILLNTPAMLENIPFQRLLSQRKNKFENAVVVSAGPSLAKQLDLLAKYQDKLVIFVADGALKSMENAGIKPDYVLNIDHTNRALKFFDPDLKRDYLCLLSTATHPDLVCALNHKCLILRSDDVCRRFKLNDFGYLDTGTMVSHAAYAIALELGFKNIIMIGQDLAFDEDGRTHAKGYAYSEHSQREIQVQKIKTLAYGGKKEVLTHVSWNHYRIKLEFFLANYQDKAHFINATEGGARIAWTEELSFKECCERLLRDKKPYFPPIKTLTKNRSDRLLSKFIENLKEDSQILEYFLQNSNSLHDMLENVLNANKDLPLNFLQNVVISIENFNEQISKDSLLGDIIFKACFFQRGVMISKVLSLKLIDEKYHLLHYINAYKEWLLIFQEDLHKRKDIIYKSLQSYEDEDKS